MPGVGGVSLVVVKNDDAGRAYVTPPVSIGVWGGCSSVIFCASLFSTTDVPDGDALVRLEGLLASAFKSSRLEDAEVLLKRFAASPGDASVEGANAVAVPD